MKLITVGMIMVLFVVAGALLYVEDLIDTVDSVLRTRASVPSIVITPRRPG